MVIIQAGRLRRVKEKVWGALVTWRAPKWVSDYLRMMAYNRAGFVSVIGRLSREDHGR